MKDIKFKMALIYFLLIVYIIASYTVENTMLLIYMLKPLGIIVIAALSYLLLNDYKPKKTKHSSNIMSFLTITSLIFIILYFLLGVLTGFSKNPYDTNLYGIALNFIAFGSIALATEFIRGNMIGSSRNMAVPVNSILLVVLLTVSELNFLINYSEPIVIFKFIATLALPLLIENIMLTYASYKGGIKGPLIYKFLIRGYIWVVPIIPDFEWILESLFDYMLPFFTLLIIYYTINSNDDKIDNKELEETDPKKWIPTISFIVVLILFIVGALPYVPISVVSNSMYPDIEVGDVVIIEKCDFDEVEIGDIIRYVKDDYTVIHRVVEKYEGENITDYIVTKGDNNNSVDRDPVYETQVLGKVVFSIPKLGLPAYWVSNAINAGEDVEVETGN